MRISKRTILAAIAASVLGCTWVPLTDAGRSVRTLPASAVAGCEKVGTTRSKTSDRVVIFARTERKVREELESLARNEAADVGGNAIVPIDAVVDGRQSFDIYRCGTP